MIASNPETASLYCTLVPFYLVMSCSTNTQNRSLLPCTDYWLLYICSNSTRIHTYLCSIGNSVFVHEVKAYLGGSGIVTHLLIKLHRIYVDMSQSSGTPGIAGCVLCYAVEKGEAGLHTFCTRATKSRNVLCTVDPAYNIVRDVVVSYVYSDHLGLSRSYQVPGTVPGTCNAFPPMYPSYYL